MISHLFRARILGTFSGVVVIRFHRIFGSIFHPHADSGKPRATIARQALVYSHKKLEFVSLYFLCP